MIAAGWMLLAGPALAGGGLPGVDLAWRRGMATLTVTPPPGEHVDPGSPVAGAVLQEDRRIDLRARGALLVDGWRVPVAPGPLDGSLRVSLCQDGGSSCRVVDLALHGEVVGRRGAGALSVAAAAPPEVDEPTPAGTRFADDPDAAFAAALDAAADSGGLVLLDFSAIWCPPCNMLSAELLDDPDDARALAGFRVVEIDVDRRDSWALKDRFSVGGYPTLVVVDARGEELDRQVGYTDEAATLRWLGEVAAPRPRDPLTEAARLARAGRYEAARGLLAEVPADEDSLVYRRTALEVAEEPAAADLAWLLEHEDSRERALEWIWGVRELAGSDPSLAAATRGFLLELTVGASPAEAADLLYVVAGLTEDEHAARAILGAAAAVLAGALTGDPDRDKGLYLALSDLYEDAGMGEQALAVVEDGVRAFPDEMTFHYAMAGLLIELDRVDDAVAEARRALELSYGDNRLRSVRRLAEALAAAGRADEALRIVDEDLDRAPVPGEGVDVRTPRYLDDLRALREELAREPPTEE